MQIKENRIEMKAIFILIVLLCCAVLNSCVQGMINNNLFSVKSNAFESESKASESRTHKSNKVSEIDKLFELQLRDPKFKVYSDRNDIATRGFSSWLPLPIRRSMGRMTEMMEKVVGVSFN